MNFLVHFSLILLTGLLYEVNTATSHTPGELKSLFESSHGTETTTTVSIVDDSVSKPYSVFSWCLQKFKYALSTVDDVVSSIYNVNAYEFIPHFHTNTSYLNWTSGFSTTMSNFITNFKIGFFLRNWNVGFDVFYSAEYNVTAMETKIREEVFGQLIVQLFVPRILKHHLNNDKPTKPLMISFHGPVGCGKTYVSQIIAGTLFEEGSPNKYKQVYHGSLHFPREKDKENYFKALRQEIYMATLLFDRAIFIFDNVDEMASGVLDAVLSSDDTYSINASKNIFLFISNSGSKKIEAILYEAWLNGFSREDLNFYDFYSHLQKAAYNAAGGLHHTKLVSKNLIDMYVPFLPLEREHVKQCIKKELKSLGRSTSKNIVENIANNFEYYPPEFELYSVSGCKKVANKVDLFGDDS